jgi:hypothetical protein
MKAYTVKTVNCYQSNCLKWYGQYKLFQVLTYQIKFYHMFFNLTLVEFFLSNYYYGYFTGVYYILSC